MKKALLIASLLLLANLLFAQESSSYPSDMGKRAIVKNWHRDPNITHGVIISSGLTLRQGEMYFADHELLLLQYSYGVHDRLQLGVSALFPISTEFNVISPSLKFMVTPRNSPVHIALGGHYTQPLSSEGDIEGGLTGFVSGTIGNTCESFTFSAGYMAPVGVTDEDEGEPFVGFTGQTQVSRGVKLIGEVAGLPNVEDGYGALIGVRFIGSQITFDLMGVRPFA